MVIVDCTVLADFYVGEARARQAARDLLRKDSNWVSVSLWRYELGNVLLKYVRSGRLRADEMAFALEEAEVLVAETVEPKDSLQVWEIALEKELSYYDASYVWLARSRGAPLYSRDGGILKKCPEYCQPMPGLK